MGKLAGGLRFAPLPGSLHSIWERKFGRGESGAGCGMDPADAAKRIIAAAGKGKKNIHTHALSRIVFWLQPAAAPLLKKLLYYAKVKKFE